LSHLDLIVMKSLISVCVGGLVRANKFELIFQITIKRKQDPGKSGRRQLSENLTSFSTVMNPVFSCMC